QRQTEPAKLTRLLRGELDWIIMKALDKERGRRYETANSLARDITSYLRHEPVQAGPPSASYKFRKFVRRNRGPGLAATVVLMALVAGIIGTTWGLVQTDLARQDAEQAHEVEHVQRKLAEHRQREAETARGQEKVQRQRAETNEKRAATERD